MAKILVIGSSNTDMVVKAPSLPLPGETILGGQFMMNQGGKGANQAIAASRLGGDISFICKLGKDDLGKAAITAFKDEGLDISKVLYSDNTSTGVALISVDDKAENSIVVAAGANGEFSIADVKSFEQVFTQFDLILLQLEIPVATVEYIIKQCQKTKVKVVLNPAPARAIDPALLAHIFLLTPNRIEAEMLTSVSIVDEASAVLAAQKLRALGVQNVIITLGSKGSLIYNSSEEYCFVPIRKVQAIDTTAAGDVFNGALCVALGEGMSLKEAAQFATYASSLAVSRMGAQSSIPHRNEVDELYSRVNHTL